MSEPKLKPSGEDSKVSAVLASLSNVYKVFLCLVLDKGRLVYEFEDSQIRVWKMHFKNIYIFVPHCYWRT